MLKSYFPTRSPCSSRRHHTNNHKANPTPHRLVISLGKANSLYCTRLDPAPVATLPRIEKPLMMRIYTRVSAINQGVAVFRKLTNGRGRKLCLWPDFDEASSNDFCPAGLCGSAVETSRSVQYSRAVIVWVSMYAVVVGSNRSAIKRSQTSDSKEV
jgi:hypothetical protein